MDSERVDLPARVGFDEVPGLLKRLTAELAVTQGASLDLSTCVHFDSSLVGLLLELIRRQQAAGKTLRLINPPENLRKLAQLYGVNGLLFDART
ncbi:MAG: STAS domain-containing protein [Quisquiliibacterium sp.]